MADQSGHGIAMRYIRQFDAELDRPAHTIDTFTPLQAIVFLTDRLRVRPRWRRALKAISTYRAYRLCGLRVVPAWRLTLAMVFYRG